MSDAILDLLEKIVPSLLSVLVATTLAVRLAFQRYKREVVWARKLDAYTKILEALHATRLYSKLEYDEALMPEGRSKEHRAATLKQAAEAWSELQRVLDVGSLIISSEAVSCLKDTSNPRTQDPQTTAPFDYWMEEERVVSEAIARVTAIARKDLAH